MVLKFISVKLLADPYMAIFRGVFDDHELYYYLATKQLDINLIA